jgi:2-polyprenyl-3-methyl-5-hydroxy-6-metoxy-1,4-benzoquinol methylase
MPEYAAVDQQQELLFPPLERPAAGGLTETIKRHYRIPALATRIFEALERAGKDPDRLSVEDLAPIDEFHIRGRQANLELAEAARIEPHHTVLDVGSGIGGPARCLATKLGCRVTGLDLTEEY